MTTSAGVENGLPILSPVDDHGRFTEEVGVPVWAGKYVFDANREVVELLREHERSCWASKSTGTPIRTAGARKRPSFFALSSNFLSASMRCASSALEGHRRGDLVAALGSKPHLRNRRIAPGLVHFAPAFVGRAASGLLRREQGGRSSRIRWRPRLRGASRISSKPGEQMFGSTFPMRKFSRNWATSESRWTRRNDTLDVWIDSGVSHEAVLRTRNELALPRGFVS